MTALSGPMQEALQHHREGDLGKAEQIYLQVLRVEPQHAHALHLLGVIAHQSGRQELALERLRAAIAVNGSFPSYHNNLGLVFRSLRRLSEAAASYRQALALEPKYPEAHNNLGNVLCELAQTQEAVAHYRQAIRQAPEFVEAHHNLGKALHELGQLPEATVAFEEAVRRNPSFVEGHICLGEALYDQGRLEEAATQYRKAIHLRPDDIAAHHSLGDVLHEMGHPEQARTIHEQSVEHATTLGSKLRAVLASREVFLSNEAFRRQRESLEADVATLLEADLSLYEPLTEAVATNFYAAYHGRNDRALQAQLATLYARAAPALLYVAPHCRARARRPSDGPLRVGFVSRFFYTHTISDVTVGLLRTLSRDIGRVFLCRFPTPEDPIAQLLRASADVVVDLPADLEAARRQIADLELDVLFYTDIGMEPLTYSLAFARLAPVQCVTWGHPVTTGLRTVDYYLSSIDLEGLDSDDHYTEQLVRLNTLPVYYYAPAFFPPAKTRSDFGLSADEPLYLCPQAPFKLLPEFDALLGGILRADARGRLLLVRSHNPQWTRLLLRRFRRTLPDVIDRITFLPHQGGQDYLHLLNVCDAILDSTPFGGGNTTYKAFAVGVPVVTLPGQLARGRVTYACYRKMGILDCVAANPDEYVRIAVRLGNDPVWRGQIRARIASARAVLFENVAAVRELECFFLDAVRRARSYQET
jgi:protein O-GlcNAc transferase